MRNTIVDIMDIKKHQFNPQKGEKRKKWVKDQMRKIENDKE